MKKVIFLIDDDEDEFELFIDALHDTPFHCECIYSGNPEQALNLLCWTVPDLIFIDYNMPRINGLKCLWEIKQIKIQQDVPLILYSSEISEELIRNAISIGAALCIKKTHRVNILAETLRHVLAMNWEIRNAFYDSK
jgi:CheY-like chemotaxis protein